jgi:hypothetical protein
MKRIISALLACLLLCGLAMPAAMALDPPIDVSGAVPLALGAATPVVEDGVYSYMQAETGWVKFTFSTNISLTLLDDEQNQLYAGSLSPPENGYCMKVLAGKTYYFVIANYNNPQWSGTLTLTAGQAPALVHNELKQKTGPVDYRPFQERYLGVTFTVDGEAAPALGFGYRSYGNGISISSSAKAGTYTLQFTNYDGEDLGTLNVILEDWSIFGWLGEYLTKQQADWANEEKTTQEWLSSVGNDMLLVLGSPVITLMIFMMGPMGWVLLPISFSAIAQLFMDTVGLFTSLFR